MKVRILRPEVARDAGRWVVCTSGDVHSVSEAARRCPDASLALGTARNVTRSLRGPWRLVYAVAGVGSRKTDLHVTLVAASAAPGNCEEGFCYV